MVNSQMATGWRPNAPLASCTCWSIFKFILVSITSQMTVNAYQIQQEREEMIFRNSIWGEKQTTRSWPGYHWELTGLSLTNMSMAKDKWDREAGGGLVFQDPQLTTERSTCPWDCSKNNRKKINQEEDIFKAPQICFTVALKKRCRHVLSDLCCHWKSPWSKRDCIRNDWHFIKIFFYCLWQLLKGIIFLIN